MKSWISMMKKNMDQDWTSRHFSRLPSHGWEISRMHRDPCEQSPATAGFPFEKEHGPRLDFPPLLPTSQPRLGNLSHAPRSVRAVSSNRTRAKKNCLLLGLRESLARDI